MNQSTRLIQEKIRDDIKQKASLGAEELVEEVKKEDKKVIYR